MDKSKQELMQEYENLKDTTRRFTQWNSLDKWVANLIEHIPTARPAVSREMRTFQQYSFDSEGTALHDDVISFDPIDGKRIE